MRGVSMLGRTSLALKKDLLRAVALDDEEEGMGAIESGDLHH